MSVFIIGDGDFWVPQSHLIPKISEKYAQNNENQNFAYEAIGINCVLP